MIAVVVPLVAAVVSTGGTHYALDRLGVRLRRERHLYRTRRNGRMLQRPAGGAR